MASEYAPLVYGRTFEVDFRYLAIPEKFSEVDLAWANQYVMASMRRPERLEGRPRRILFQNQHYRVFGVICMVKDLIDPKTQYEVDITRDKVGRPLHVFAGYVIRLASEVDQSLPSYTETMDLLQPLADYISSRWPEKNYDVERKPYVQYVPFKQGTTWKVAVDAANWKPPHPLNSDPNKVAVWPESLCSDLWRAANATKVIQAICLGLSSIEDVQRSPFLNATAIDVMDYKLIERITAKDQFASDTTARVSEQQTSPRIQFFEAIQREYQAGSINAEGRQQLEKERLRLGITSGEAWQIECEFVRSWANWIRERHRSRIFFRALISVYWRGRIDSLAEEYLIDLADQLQLSSTDIQRIDDDFRAKYSGWINKRKIDAQNHLEGKNIVSGIFEAMNKALDVFPGRDQTKEQPQRMNDSSLRYKTKDQPNDPKSTEQANRNFFPSDE